jgi:hypothetical protein
MQTPAPVVSEITRRNRVNQRIHALTCNNYFEALPLAQLKELLAGHGFQTEPLDGIYCGSEGKLAPVHVGERTWFTLSWFRMPSDRYEVTAYLS